MAYASAAASVVVLRGQWGYRISPGKKFRYAVRGYIYLMCRYAKSAAAVDAAVKGETTAPSPSTPTLDDD